MRSISSSKRTDTEPGAGAEAQVEHAVGCRGRSLGGHVTHVLAQEQHGVGEGQRVDHHEPGGHEHRPAPGEGVERATQEVHQARAHEQRRDAEHDAAVGEQQHRRDDARHHEQRARRAAGRGTAPEGRATGTAARRRTRSRSAAADAMSCPDARSAHTSGRDDARRRSRSSTRSPSIATSTASDRNAGAMTRSAVSMIGRGASVASNPTAHATHSSTAPRRRVVRRTIDASDGRSRGSRGHRQRDPRDAQQPQGERARQRDSVRSVR